jgi:hypothetical protein
MQSSEDRRIKELHAASDGGKPLHGFLLHSYAAREQFRQATSKVSSLIKLAESKNDSTRRGSFPTVNL